MRGVDEQTGALFSYLSSEALVPAEHPLRPIRLLVNQALAQLDARTSRHPGYAISQRLRKRIEEPFGWIKAAAGLRKTHHRGLKRVAWMVTLTVTACNLVRLPKLIAAAA